MPNTAIALYWIFLYWASSTRHIFAVLPSRGLWQRSCQNSLENAPLKSIPVKCLSTRTHQIWPRISPYAIWYERILNEDNIEGELYWLTQHENTIGLSAHQVIFSKFYFSLSLLTNNFIYQSIWSSSLLS